MAIIYVLMMQWCALIKVMYVTKSNKLTCIMKYCIMNHMISHMHVITIVAGLEITFSDHVDIL